MPDTPIVELENVGYTAGGNSIVQRANWSIMTGEHWAVVGPNGAGKTTLLKIACGYLWPNAGGVVRRCGKTLTDLRELRRSIGWVTSTLAVKIPPHEKALDTVVSGKFGQTGLVEMAWDRPCPGDYEKARRLLNDLECPGVAGKRFAVLSQGEQQKVLLARAHMAEPLLLILDEPCAGLDPGARERFLAALDRLARSAEVPSMVMVTHHLEEIMPAFDRLLVVREGRIVRSGSTTETIDPSLISDLYGAPVSRLHAENGRYWPIW